MRPVVASCQLSPLYLAGTSAAPRGRSGAGTVGKDLAKVGGIRQHAAQGRAIPGPVSPRRSNTQAIKTALQGVEWLTLVGEPG